VGIYDLNTSSVGLNSYKVPFKGIESNATSNPINSNDDTGQMQELASKELSTASKATAMAQIMTGSRLKYDTTRNEYVAQLLKQGKIPNKHFQVEDGEKFASVKEINSKGQRIKEVHFPNIAPERGVSCAFYNPNTQQKYKAIEYTTDGGFSVALNNPTTGEPIADELYRSDGSLADYVVYDKCEKGETSVNGKYKISGIEIPQS